MLIMWCLRLYGPCTSSSLSLFFLISNRIMNLLYCTSRISRLGGARRSKYLYVRPEKLHIWASRQGICVLWADLVIISFLCQVNVRKVVSLLSSSHVCITVCLLKLNKLTPHILHLVLWSCSLHYTTIGSYHQIKSCEFSTRMKHQT